MKLILQKLKTTVGALLVLTLTTSTLFSTHDLHAQQRHSTQPLVAGENYSNDGTGALNSNEQSALRQFLYSYFLSDPTYRQITNRTELDFIVQRISDQYPAVDFNGHTEILDENFLDAVDGLTNGDQQMAFIFIVPFVAIVIAYLTIPPSTAHAPIIRIETTECRNAQQRLDRGLRRLRDRDASREQYCDFLNSFRRYMDECQWGSNYRNLLNEYKCTYEI